MIFQKDGYTHAKRMKLDPYITPYTQKKQLKTHYRLMYKTLNYKTPEENRAKPSRH